MLSDAGAIPADAAAIAHADPSVLGPYAIGNITRTFVDESRSEELTPDPSDFRTLVTEIWYPAAAETASQQEDTLGGFLPEDPTTFKSLAAGAFALDEARYQELMQTPTRSVREASLAEGGPFPVVLFSHGNGGFRFQSIFLAEHLASHGYIVVSADHTGNALVTYLPSGPVTYNLTSTQGLDGRIADMSFLLDTMTELDAGDPDGRFQGAVDVERVAMTGHSFGGITTTGLVDVDDRIDVGVPMAGASTAPTTATTPIMYMVVTEDFIVGSLAGELSANFKSWPGARWLVTLVDGGHFSFSDVCLLNPNFFDACGAPGQRLSDGSSFTFLDIERAHAITTYYQTALYGYYLKGDTAYAQELSANPFGSDVLLDSTGQL
jgi:predicted dienelactone hydrolase